MTGFTQGPLCHTSLQSSHSSAVQPSSALLSLDGGPQSSHAENLEPDLGPQELPLPLFKYLL